MPYKADIKLFKTLLRFVNVKYYRGIDSCLNGSEMALNGIVGRLYVIDIEYYTVIDDSWGIGVRYVEFMNII
jgi:hypothetical protein